MLVGTSGGDPEESGGSSGGDVGTADRSSGSRWPRHETVTLIQIRTDMDAEFRDAAIKTPLWDKVSKKLAELGYSRSAKKCREKFENVFKYYKRTKDCRYPKSEGKSYHYFDQLEVLDSQPPPQSDLATTQATPLSIAMPAQNLPQTVTCNPIPSQQNPLSISFSAPPPTTNQNVPSVSFSTSTSSDEEEPERQGKRKRKRKWADFFDRLTSEVMGRQEEMQRKFLEALEKREQEHLAREEAWRAQEVARMSREHEILAQERAVAAAKDAAVFAFLQKVSADDKQIPSDQPQPPPPPPPPTAVPLASVPTPVSAYTPSPSDLQMITSLQSMRKPKLDDRGEIVNLGQNPSPSRWPKSEIEALIKLRTNLDLKYHDNLPKGPLWEEISAGMLRLGYNRNPKRCKEKWENINKYYKKMKESNKKRPEDSKTCPYFDQLEAIYRERAKTEQVKQENVAVPIMVQPERQWPAMDGHHSDDDVDNEDGAANYDRSTVGTTQ